MDGAEMIRAMQFLESSSVVLIYLNERICCAG